MQSNRNEQSLMARMQAGEQAAVGELYDLYGGMIYALAHRLTHNAAETEEIVLDVFTQAWRKARGYDAARGSVVKWLLSLAGNRIRMQPTARHFTAAESC